MRADAALRVGPGAGGPGGRRCTRRLKAKIAPLNLGNRVRAGTFHSFGLAAWRRAYPDVKCGPEAAREKADRTVKALNIKPALENFVLRLMSLAKQTAVGLDIPMSDDSVYWKLIEHFDMLYDLEDEDLAPEGVKLAMHGLHLHSKHANTIIDFDDMIWMPVISNIKLWQNDVVFVDEAQDTNPCRRAYVAKMLNPSRGRAIFVGDRHQAIYGFTGADNDAVDQIIRDFNCVSLPLTVTYRCPKAVVAKAQEVVSHIQAHETAPTGKVSTIQQEQFNVDFVAPLQQPYAPTVIQRLNATDAILCRKTKPLVETAFGLIRAGIACHVEGKDIGAGLISLIEGSSVDPAIVDRVRAEVGDAQRVLVLLDSNHSFAHVTAELEAYCGLVTPGSYIVATDGIMQSLSDVPRGQPGWQTDNPSEAARRFAAAHPEFVLEQPEWPFNESNLTRNLTHWPDGWLRRRSISGIADVPFTPAKTPAP